MVGEEEEESLPSAGDEIRPEKKEHDGFRLIGETKKDCSPIMQTYTDRELHTWLIKRTTLESDKDMNVNVLTAVAFLCALGMLKRTNTHESRILEVVGAVQSCSISLF